MSYAHKLGELASKTILAIHDHNKFKNHNIYKSILFDPIKTKIILKSWNENIKL